MTRKRKTAEKQVERASKARRQADTTDAGNRGPGRARPQADSPPPSTATPQAAPAPGAPSSKKAVPSSKRPLRSSRKLVPSSEKPVPEVVDVEAPSDVPRAAGKNGRAVSSRPVAEGNRKKQRSGVAQAVSKEGSPKQPGAPSSTVAPEAAGDEPVLIEERWDAGNAQRAEESRKQLPAIGSGTGAEAKERSKYQPFDISIYTFTRVFMDLGDIKELKFQSREVTEEHVGNLMDKFKNGLNPAMCTIAVTPMDEGLQEGPDQFEDGETVVVKTWLVDGRHRMRVFSHKKVEEPEEWEALSRHMPVTMIERKDKEYLEIMEVLGLSSYFNSQSSTVLPTDFLDLMHAAISGIRLIAALERKTKIKHLVLSSVAKELKERHTLGGLDVRQIIRYVTVGMYLAEDDEKYSLFKDAVRRCPQIGLVHFVSHTLLAYHAPLFGLAVDCVEARIRNGMPGSFEDFRDQFYGFVKRLYGQVKATAEYKGMGVESLLEKTVDISGKPMRLREVITYCMGRYVAVQSQEASDKRRLTNLRKRMVEILGDDLEPEDAGDPSEQTKAKTAGEKEREASGEEESAGGGEEERGKGGEVESAAHEEERAVGEEERAAGAEPVTDPEPLQSNRGPRRTTRNKRIVLDHSSSDEYHTSSEEESDEDSPRPAMKKKAQKGPAKKQPRQIAQQTVQTDTAMEDIELEELNIADDEIVTVEPVSLRRAKSPASESREEVPASEIREGGPVSERRGTIEPVVTRATFKQYLRHVSAADLSKMIQDLDLEYQLVPKGLPSTTGLRSKPAPSPGASRPAAGPSSAAVRSTPALRSTSHPSSTAAPIAVDRRDAVGQVKKAKAKRANVFPARDIFDDFVPGDLPVGYDDPEGYTGADKPLWTKFVTKQPSRWPDANPIEHVSPWMKMIYLPDEHRGHVVVPDVETLLRNHHAVFWRAAHNFYKRLPKEELLVSEERFANVTGSERTWAAAIEDDDAALEFFAQSREQLNQQGYCVFENFLDDSGVPDKVGGFAVPKVESRGFFSCLADKALAGFPGERNLKTLDERMVWNVVSNTGDERDEEEASKGQGRFRLTNHGIAEAIEKDAETVWMVKERVLLDIRIGQAVAALKICDNGSARVRKMFMPRTGGRWMVTSEKCERQVLHSDFYLLSRQDTLNVSGNPGYFVLCTGKHEVPLWVCPGSHRSLATASEATIDALSSVSAVNVVRIPPFSIFMGRGDLQHAGASFADGNGYDRNIRYYLHLVPNGLDIPDSLQVIDSFTPRFKANIDEDTDSDDDGDQEEEESGGEGDGSN